MVEPTLEARNWWPGQLRDLVASVGFEIVDVDFALPLFAQYRWLPESLINLYDRRLAWLERRRWIRRFGVSTLIAAQKGASARLQTNNRPNVDGGD
jgi:hypothetical protein